MSTVVRGNYPAGWNHAAYERYHGIDVDETALPLERCNDCDAEFNPSEEWACLDLHLCPDCNRDRIRSKRVFEGRRLA